MENPSAPPCLDLSGISKRYPGVLANDNVGFTVRPGEVHALLGENGAGKSTLVKIIYGLVKPDTGQMRFNGRDFAPGRPSDARAAGVAMVFQHFSLFEALNVAENVALGMENPPPMRELAARIRAVSEEYGLPLDPSRMVGDLSAGERQRVDGADRHGQLHAPAARREVLGLHLRRRQAVARELQPEVRALAVEIAGLADEFHDGCAP